MNLEQRLNLYSYQFFLLNTITEKLITKKIFLTIQKNIQEFSL